MIQIGGGNHLLFLVFTLAQTLVLFLVIYITVLLVNSVLANEGASMMRAPIPGLVCLGLFALFVEVIFLPLSKNRNALNSCAICVANSSKADMLST